MPESTDRRSVLSTVEGPVLSPAETTESNRKTPLSITPAWQVRQAIDYLMECGVSTARLDAEVLLAQTLQTNRAGLYLHYFSPLDQEQIDKFWRLVGRRGKREPLSYITGRQEFWSLEFLVDRWVLIPRPETEVLIETVLRIIREGIGAGLKPAPTSQDRARIRDWADPGLPKIPEKIRVLDIGTGSGCIAVTLAKELPEAKIWAVDISTAALTVAKVNATRHQVTKQITFLLGDLFAPVADQEGFFDLIVSNPPYVAEEELSTLEAEVQKWEPRLALNGGKAGVDFHQRLIAGSPRYLRQGGRLIMEIGQGQERAIARLTAGQGEFTCVHFVKDYAGIDRVVAIQTKAISGR